MAEMESLDLGPWDGGVNYSADVEDLEPNEISDMSNCRVGPGGYVQKRLGTSSYKSIAAIATNNNFTLCGQFYEDATTGTVFIVCHDTFYEATTGPDAWTDRTGGMTITASDDNTFEWCRAHATLVITNGVNPVYKWAGSGGNNLTTITMPGSATTAKHCAYWDNRVWLANMSDADDRLWYSDNDDPDTWASTSFNNFGYPITGLMPFQNGLAIHTQEGIWLASATGNAEHLYQYQQRVGGNPNLPVQGGTVSGRCILSLPNNQQLFLLTSGVYKWEGGEEIEKISGKLDIGYWDSLNKARFSQAHAVYYAQLNEAWFFLPYGSSQTNMNHIMIYSTEITDEDGNGIWFGPYEGFERNCSAIIDNVPHAGDFDGKLLDHWPADTYNDESAAISANFTTAAPPPEEDDTTTNRWYFARHFYDNTGDYNVTVIQDAAALTGTTTMLNVSGYGFTLDTDALDQGKLGLVRMMSRDTKMQGYSAHSSIQYANGVADEYFRMRHVHLQHKSMRRDRKRKAGA